MSNEEIKLLDTQKLNELIFPKEHQKACSKQVISKQKKAQKQ